MPTTEKTEQPRSGAVAAESGRALRRTPWVRVGLATAAALIVAGGLSACSGSSNSDANASSTSTCIDPVSGDNTCDGATPTDTSTDGGYSDPTDTYTDDGSSGGTDPTDTYTDNSSDGGAYPTDTYTDDGSDGGSEPTASPLTAGQCLSGQMPDS